MCVCRGGGGQEDHSILLSDWEDQGLMSFLEVSHVKHNILRDVHLAIVTFLNLKILMFT